jgi:hypothetical protein
VHLYSRGIPRVINLLCEHALINAYVDQTRSVSAPLVEEVAREFQFDGIKPLTPSRTLGERNSVIPMPARGVDATVSKARTEMERDFLNEFLTSPIAEEVARLEVVKSDTAFADEPCASAQVPNSVPEPYREWEAATFFRSARQRLAAPEQDHGLFVSEPDSGLSPDRFLNALRPTPGRSLRWIAAKMKCNDPSAATPDQTPNRQKPVWTAFAKGAARHFVSCSKVVHHSFLRLVRSSSGWRDWCLSQLNSGSWQQMMNRSYRWLKGPIHAVQPFPRWFVRRDRYLSTVNSTEWEQMAGSLSRWLREPFDPARWLAAAPQLLGAGRALSQKKP